MKIACINYSDKIGGAARAAYRIHRAVISNDIDSLFLAADSSTGDWTVQGPCSTFSNASRVVRSKFGRAFTKLLKTNNSVIHSPSIFSSNWLTELNSESFDLLHLHWVQDEMISVSDIGKIVKPVVWTLHDMWPFCGAEHYTTDFRWRDGYNSFNRPLYEAGFDLNRWTWLRKQRNWKHPMHMVSPSNWLASCVRDSSLMSGWPVTVIPNAIDTATWVPIEQDVARRLLGLPRDVPLILFGAMGGACDPRKGYDLLQSALNHLRNEVVGMEIVIFGQLAPRFPPKLGFPAHYVGYVHDDLALRVLYSAADVMIVPSRQDNLPNTAVESFACGTPVVSFNVGGMPDIVSHLETGYLADMEDSEDLASGIKWILSDTNRLLLMRERVRAQAVKSYSYSVVGEKYKELYTSILK